MDVTYTFMYCTPIRLRGVAHHLRFWPGLRRFSDDIHHDDQLVAARLRSVRPAHVRRPQVRGAAGVAWAEAGLIGMPIMDSRTHAIVIFVVSPAEAVSIKHSRMPCRCYQFIY